MMAYKKCISFEIWLFWVFIFVFEDVPPNLHPNALGVPDLAKDMDAKLKEARRVLTPGWWGRDLLGLDLGPSRVKVQITCFNLYTNIAGWKNPTI